MASRPALRVTRTLRFPRACYHHHHHHLHHHHRPQQPFRPAFARTFHRSPASTAPSSTADLTSDSAVTGDAYQNALAANKQWAQKVHQDEPEFLPTGAKGQAPPILWLGCADSRVPETTILGCKPGDVFTHRNIANIINSTDISLLSIVQYAVLHLQVKHIVLCGHTSCGGVAASLANSKIDILDIWLQPLRSLREKYHDELESMDQSERGVFLSKKNVEAGVENLKRIPVVIDAIHERGLQVHGLLYTLATGLLEEVDVSEEHKIANKRVAAFERK